MQFSKQGSFPLNGQCQITEVVFEGTLSNNQPNYKGKNWNCGIGIAEESFKECLYNHNLSWRNYFFKNSTELSKDSGKSRWRMTLPKKLGKLSENAYQIIITVENVIYF